ncbi:MAG: hypothetical protein JWR44_2139, partial [Hymenobacter sp.]|nr:hypothetical protein [Hymenobacter sp.]
MRKTLHSLLRRRGPWASALLLGGLLLSSGSAQAQTSYCATGLGGVCGGNDVTAVSIGGTTLNATGLTCTAAGGQSYTSYPATGANTGTLSSGTPYTLSVTLSGSSIVSVWIDYNRNFTFEASEWTQVATASPVGTPATVSIVIPTNAVQGQTGMRIRSRGVLNANGPGDACTNFGSGETKDFTITIGAPAACPIATGLTATGITATGATINFTPSASATSYTVTVTPAGGTATTVTPAPTTSPVTLTGLTASTNYTVSVVSNCGGGLTSAANTVTFNTSCLTAPYAAVNNTTAYTQDFETTWLSQCGTNEAPAINWRNTPVTGNNSWRRDDDAASAGWGNPNLGLYTPAGSPLNGGTSAHSARFHSYQAASGSQGSLDLYVNMAGTVGTPTLLFDYINTSGTDSLSVLISTNGGTTFTTRSLARFTTSAAWTRQTVNLPSTGLTATTIIRLRATGDFGVTDIGVDNVRVAYVTCPAVTGATAGSITSTGATITFTPGSASTSYTVTVTPAGGTATTITPAPTASPITLTGLTPNTGYTVSIVGNCSGSQTSTASVVTFTTTPVPAVNDNCAQAIAITVGANCTTPTSGNAFGATQSLAPTSCGGTVANDVWYSFVATAAALQLNSGAQFTGYYDIRSGTCATSTSIACGALGTIATPSLGLITGLTVNQTYYLRVYATATPTATASNFTLCLTPVSNYCNTGLGGICGGNDVTAVSIGGTTLNATGLTCTTANSQSYTDYPATGANTGTLSSGTPYTLSVTLSGSSIVSVWIDYNHNLVFEASEWTQVATASPVGTPATVTIVIPTNAVQGQTGMRIRSRGVGSPNGAADACTQFFSGETKDFTITIGAPAACPIATGLTATGITATGATINFTPSASATSYIVTVTPAGGTATTVTPAPTTSPVTLTGLTASTSYTVSITSSCAGGQTSTANTVTFTTSCLTAPYAAVNNTTAYTQDFETTWLSQCGTNEAPAINWRSTPVLGNNSWRRDDDGASAGWVSPTSWSYTPAGSPLSGGTSLHSARFHSGEVLNRAQGSLDLYVNMAGTAGTPTLTFDYINTSGSDSLSVLISTNGGTTFTTRPLARFTTASAWTRQTVNLPSTGLTATTVIRLRATGDFGVTDIGVDNVRVAYVACPAVTGLTAGAITTTTASLTFAGGAAGTTYTATITPAGGTATTQTITASPLNLTGLTPGLSYTVSIVSNCGGGLSSQPAVVTFSAQPIPPVNDDCAGALNVPVQFGTCIGQTSADNTAATDSQGAPAPTCASYQGKDVWFKVTVPASGAVTVETLPPTGGSPITDTGMSIYSGTCATLTEVDCDDDSSLNGNYSLITLTARTPGEVLYIRLWAYNNGNVGQLALCVTSPSNCAVPTGPTSSNLTNTTATLAWTGQAGGLPAGNSYTVEYGVQGFAQGTGTVLTNLTASTLNLTGLQPNTAYCYYVRQNCGAANGSSSYVGPTCFTTPLTAPANNEPCGATPLGSATITSTNVGATTSVQNGINLPACSSAQLPKDVWFVFRPTGTSATITVNGAPA